MFQQMNEALFDYLLSTAIEHGNNVGDALQELKLYRELGTLQQLSYATDAVRVETANRICALEEERDKYAMALAQIAEFPHAPDAYIVAKAALEKS